MTPNTAYEKNSSSWIQRMRQPPWAECAILALAAALRFWRLGYHSVWFDEAVSLKWAQSDASYIWQVTFPLIEDKHPPAYYLLLHYWRELLTLFGLASSDVAQRSIGSLLGILTVAGIMLLASGLGKRSTGLLAGLLVAISPLLVWYSQELRMFQPATTAIIGSACGLQRAWQHSSERKKVCVVGSFSC